MSTIVGDLLHWFSDGPYCDGDAKRDYGLQTEEGNELVHQIGEVVGDPWRLKP